MASSQQGSSKLWILVAVLLLIILAATATITWLIVEKPARAGEQLGVSLVKPAAPLFLKLEPFTVNLQGSDYGGRLLYVGITLDLGNDQSMSFIQDHLPQVRNRLLMVLSGQDATALVTREGKQKLAAQIGASLLEPFTQQQPKLVVNDVLFTQFIVQ